MPEERSAEDLESRVLAFEATEDELLEDGLSVGSGFPLQAAARKTDAECPRRPRRPTRRNMPGGMPTMRLNAFANANSQR